MPTLTLNRAQFTKLNDFCKKHDHKQFFVAKDHGAYIGSSAGEEGNCVFYFKGCDPQKDADYYHTARDLFGGDDFGEFFPVDILAKAVNHPQVSKMKFSVSKTKIAVNYL